MSIIVDRAGMGHDRPLTLHQCGVAACILEAMTNKEIARAMGHHEVTAESHVRALMERFEARNRVHLAIILDRIAREDVPN